MSARFYRPMRNYGCRITDDLIYKGYRSIILENERLLVQLLLDKGSEPIRWLHKPTDTDFIWFTRLGLLPATPIHSDYQMTYLGGWQEMLPEVSGTHSYRGAQLHRGESSITPWDYEIVIDSPDEIVVRLTNRLRSLPLRVEKTISLRSGSTTVRVEENVFNESPLTEIEFNWGHHLAYGPPFISEKTRVRLGQEALVYHPEREETTPWPHVVQDGVESDLSALGAPGSSRDLLAIVSHEGKYRLERPEDGLTLEVRWDQDVWPYLWYWQNYGGNADAPFFGCEYNIGLEMFNVPPKLTLAEAAEKGIALKLKPNGFLSSWIEWECLEPNAIQHKEVER